MGLREGKRRRRRWHCRGAGVERAGTRWYEPVLRDVRVPWHCTVAALERMGANRVGACGAKAVLAYADSDHKCVLRCVSDVCA